MPHCSIARHGLPLDPCKKLRNEPKGHDSGRFRSTTEFPKPVPPQGVAQPMRKLRNEPKPSIPEADRHFRSTTEFPKPVPPQGVAQPMRKLRNEPKPSIPEADRHFRSTTEFPKPGSTPGCRPTRARNYETNPSPTIPKQNSASDRSTESPTPVPLQGAAQPARKLRNEPKPSETGLANQLKTDAIRGGSRGNDGQIALYLLYAAKGYHLW
jgi:hypothetical protein